MLGESHDVPCMTANRSALPRDVRSLRQMVVDKEASLAEPERIIAEKETQLSVTV